MEPSSIPARWKEKQRFYSTELRTRQNWRRHSISYALLRLMDLIKKALKAKESPFTLLVNPSKPSLKREDTRTKPSLNPASGIASEKAFLEYPAGH
jgi:hypothetical protein